MLKLVERLPMSCDDYFKSLLSDGSVQDILRDRPTPERLLEYLEKCAAIDAVELWDASTWTPLDIALC